MAEAQYSFTNALRGDIARRLSTFPIEPVEDDGLRRAAVCLVVAQDPRDGQASVLITLRPRSINRHSGQYALPGGRLDAGETAREAALRELDEELGLRCDGGQVLGRLDDFPTRSGFCISPFVIWADDVSTLTPDPSEVAEVYHLPFVELDSPKIPKLRGARAGDQPVLSAYFRTLGHSIFAPTAAILYQFRELALRGDVTRAAHFEQPRFAWK